MGPSITAHVTIVPLSALAGLVFLTACEPDGLPPYPVHIDPVTSPITAEALFAEMADPLLLTRAAALPWASGLASSHDRRSIDPASADWYANADWTGFVRTEGVERVMLDVDGPGAIVRIWSALPSGILRIYLDGATTPVVEADMAALLSGKVPPFEAPFAFTVANGANLVYPIPFASHAKVTTTATSLYYNVDYRTYAPGTEVVSFAGTEWRGSAARSAAASALAGYVGPAEGNASRFSLASETATPVTIAAPTGGGIITSLTFDVDRVDADAMRRTMVVMRFDGETTVEAPLGDLFAFEPAGTDVHALPVSADHEGRFVLRFPMPFAQFAAFELVDVGAGPVHASVTATVGASRFDDDSFHFHARWTGVRTFDAFDPHLFHVAAIEGSGVYVGTVLHVANSSPAWWGEGDEQIWVDGEAFPAHFGTGTEDYFGYSFCTTERFSHPYLGQTRANESDFGGFTSLYRFHFADAIPFSTSLVFDLEVLHWEKGHSHPLVQYDAVYYFYARPGATVQDGHRDPNDFFVPFLPDAVVHTGIGWTRC